MTHAVGTDPPHGLACMEIWGGSGPFRGRVAVPGHEVSIVSEPYRGGGKSGEGGDVYLLSNCAAGLITRFVLADVSGHGEEAAVVSAALRGLMRRHINTADQTQFAFDLNRAFDESDTGGRFATALLATYFAPTRHLILCNAGHPRPLVYRSETDRWALADFSIADAAGDTTSPAHGIRNLPLGVLHPTAYRQVAIPLAPGDAVVLYTDALIESRRPDGSMLGEQGLLELARALTPAERADAAPVLTDRVRSLGGGGALADDATAVSLHHHGGEPPRPGWREWAVAMARSLGLGPIESGPALIRS
ncbi:MAG: serine/threonine-protein phosphatase [Phycisphaerales bacterium]|nr:serine/threonine-protein phosphatase [Phycisphaerales bacterium]